MTDLLDGTIAGRTEHMPIVSAKEMLFDAAKNGYAVGAFNVTNLGQMAAVVEAASAHRTADGSNLGHADEIPQTEGRRCSVSGVG